MTYEIFENRRREYAQCKVFHHFDRLEHILQGDYLKVVPISVELDVTNKCQHRCFYCYQFISNEIGLDWGMHNSEDETDFDHACRLLHEMGVAGVKAVEYCGRGEPFLYPHFTDILKETRQAGLHAGIISSGSMLTEEKALAVRDAKPEWIRFSLDSLSENVFNRIRRPKDPEAECDAVKKNITRFCNVMTSISSTRISASTVILPQNLDELYDLALFTKECGMQAHVFRLVNYNNRDKFYQENWGKVKRTLKNIQDSLEDKTFSVYLPPVDFYLKQRKPFERCFFSLLDWAIDVNFNVYGCLENIFNKRFLLGNIGSQGQSFMELVESKRRLEIMNMVCSCPPCCRDEVNNLLESFALAIHPNFI